VLLAALAGVLGALVDDDEQRRRLVVKLFTGLDADGLARGPSTTSKPTIRQRMENDTVITHDCTSGATSPDGHRTDCYTPKQSVTVPEGYVYNKDKATVDWVLPRQRVLV
jgi:hypothetical protein